MTGSARAASRSIALLGYALTLGGAVAAYLLVRSYGKTLSAPALQTLSITSSTASPDVHGPLHLLLALVVIIAAARALGSFARRLNQPQVAGEIIAGILLGPSLLGWIAPSAFAYLFPAAVLPSLNVISQVGVILYMFLVGLELDPALLRKRGPATVAISTGSIVAPFVLGTVIALLLYPRLSSANVSFTDFSLFVGVSMSVTAFPVLARILTDRGIHSTRMGAIALTCAAVNDLTAWCLLAFVVSVAEARAAGSLMTIGLALGFVALLIIVVRPAMYRLSLLYGNRGRLTQGVMAMVFIGLLLSASATELIGIHAVFGAFALGAVIPHDSGMARELTDRLEDLVIVLLLPAFFVFTGLQTQIGLVSGADQWLLCGLIIIVASIGKFGGTVAAGRLTGLGLRDASALGVLMNTRGLMELIVLSIGLQMGIIGPALFAMLVLMALVTTLATTPILHLITGRDEAIMAEDEAIEVQPAARHPLPGARGTVLVPISDPEGVQGLVELALAATPPDAPAPRVLALVRRPAGGARSGLREFDDRVAPRSPALSIALEYARARNVAITPQAVWSDDPAPDILKVAAEPDVAWLLLGSHRSVFGTDFTGGVVREVLEKAKRLPIHVGVVVRGADLALGRVCVVADQSADGRTAIELAAGIAQRGRRNLHALIVPAHGGHADPALLELLRGLGRRVHIDVLASPTAAQLASQAPEGLIVIGANLAAKLHLPHESFYSHRALVVVQSSGIAIAGGSAVPALPRSASS